LIGAFALLVAGLFVRHRGVAWLLFAAAVMVFLFGDQASLDQTAAIAD
jgi:putative exporter of polyketide antibiotics